jgi:hypothetical protein
MVDLRKYSKRLEEKLGETKSADQITEGLWWDVVMNELNEMSIECARELQEEIGVPYTKPARDGVAAYVLGYDQAPPTRLLAQVLILNHWLGWINNEKQHDNEPVKAWDKIQGAYMDGRALSEKKEVP